MQQHLPLRRILVAPGIRAYDFPQKNSIHRFKLSIRQTIFTTAFYEIRFVKN